MTSKIRSALHNCEQHESKMLAFVKKASDSKLVVPLALTAGFIATGALLGPAISSHLSSFADLVKTSVDGVVTMKESSPKIFYGLVSGLIAGGAVLAAIGYLENREEKKSAKAGCLDLSVAKNIEQAWESIVQTNATVTKRVAHHQAWAIDVLRNTSPSADILKKHGFNPENRTAMLDLQKAYIQGVKQAFVTAREEGRTAIIGGSTFDQYTNKNIMRGMVGYYKQLGYSLTPGPNKTVQACEIVTSGLSAIRELALKDAIMPSKGASRERSGDQTISR